MKDLFGEMCHVDAERPVFRVAKGSAAASIVVVPWSDDDAVINVRSYVVTGAETTPELMRFLLTQNDKFRFGAFGLDSDGDIFVEHTIVGSGADRNELRASILAILVIADEFDDQIQERWGGLRAIDRVKR